VIAKITTGAGFRGSLDYLMSRKADGGQGARQGAQQKAQAARRQLPGEEAGDGPAYARGERHRVIGGNMSGRTPRELAAEFGAIRRQRPSISKPVHHVSLSAAEGERLTVEQWQQVASKYVEGMGFADSPFVVVQHRDTGIDHIHILTSRVDVNGRVVRDSYEKRRAEEIMREVEREYGLKPVALSREVERAAPKRGEIETFERTGELSAKMSLQGRVERALRPGPAATEGPTVTEFIERLERSGVEIIPHIQSTGRVSGISFRQGEELMKGSDLGRGFSWGGLQKRGLDYDAARDGEAIAEAWKRAYPDRTDGPPSPQPAPPKEDSFRALKELGELGTMAGRYVLDQANPVKQIEDQIRMVEQMGEGLVEGYRMAREGYRAAREFLRPSGIEQLQQAAGMEGSGDEREALERLSRAAGSPTPDAPTAPTGEELSEPPVNDLDGPGGEELSGPSAADPLGAEAEATEAGQAAEVEAEVETAESIIEFLF